MAVDSERVEKALKGVKDLFGDGDIVTGKRVEKIKIDGDSVMLSLGLPTDDTNIKRAVEDECRAAIKTIDGVAGVMIMTRNTTPGAETKQNQAKQPAAADNPDPWAERAPIPGVKHIIAVSSAKGGVGKSTICVNLALALAKRGAKVGVLDADIYGPSIHLLMDVKEDPKPGVNKEVAAIEKDGLKLMSLGFFTERGVPVIWRGPMVMSAVKKFLQDVEWGELDYLMIDTPPGTGDAQLTMLQTVPLTSAIIVTTSSELALADTEKGFSMYRSLKTPVMGIIENMSHFVCPHCNERTDIFGSGEGEAISKRLDTRLLGGLPLDPEVRSDGDRGKPIVKVNEDSPVTKAFLEIADKVIEMYPAGS